MINVKKILKESSIILLLLGGAFHITKVIWWDFPQVKADTHENKTEIKDQKKILCKLAFYTIKNDQEIIEICSK